MSFTHETLWNVGEEENGKFGFFESRILGAFLGVDVGMIKVTIEVGFACVGGRGGGVCCVDLGSGGISTLCSFSLLVFLL